MKKVSTKAIHNSSPSWLSRVSSKLKKKFWLWFAVALFTGGTGYALYQPLNPNAWQDSGFWNRFLYPQEHNSIRRFASVSQRINAITVVGDSIWLVGNGGLILHSRDKGQCWSVQGHWVKTRDTDVCPLQLSGWQRILSGQLNNLKLDRLLGSMLPQAQAADSRSKEPLKQQAVDITSPLQAIEPKLQPRTKQQAISTEPPAKKQLEPTLQQNIMQQLASELIEIPPVISQASLDFIPNLNDVAFFDQQRGLAVGDTGVILQTTDGGKNWSISRYKSGFQLLSLTLKAENLAIISGEYGTILRSENAGTRWSAIESNTSETLNDVTLTPTRQGVAVGHNGTILYSGNDGQSWSTHKSPSPEHLRAVLFSPDGQAIVAGDNATLLHARTATGNWTRIDIPSRENLRSLALVEQQQILAIGDNNQLLLSDRNTENWQKIRPDRLPKLFYMTESDVQSVIAVGEQGAILQRFAIIDSAYQEKPYSVSLANWWYLLTTICIALVIIALWPRLEITPDEGIAGLATSDKPLQPGDPDALNLGAIAGDIARFLSNPKTTAPLTMAITGPWGSGKSSLMNLIQSDLKTRGFSPVWFNAWHHQKGEQLLASLFAHIKLQAIPSFFSFDGLWFRAKLAFIRGRRHWFIFAIMLSLLFMTLSINKPEITLFLQQLSLLSDPKNWWNVPWDSVTPNFQLLFQSEDWIQLIASILGIGTPLVAFLRSVRGFGINPRRLISIDHGRETQKGYDPGARARFAQEFRDVTQALGHNKMVIFIDDLDRCTQENLIDILENINFISSSGDCFLILGMAPKYIEACIANAYATLAASIAQKEVYEKHQPDGNTEKHKFNFAHNYLEKMINIEITIPGMQQQNIDQLLYQKTATGNRPDWRDNLRLSINRLSGALNLSIPLLIIVLAVASGWEYGRKIPDQPAPAVASTYQLGANDRDLLLALSASDNHLKNMTALLLDNKTDTDSSTASRFTFALQADQTRLQQGVRIATLGQGSGKERLHLLMKLSPETDTAVQTGKTFSPAETVDTMDKPPSTPTRAAEFHQPKVQSVARLSALKLVLGLLVFISFAFYLYQKKTESYSEDSDDFKQALTTWTPWIQLKQETPRAVKRFLNHLRFLAIRNNRELPESILVGMATIYFYNNSWLLEDEKFDLLTRRQSFDLLSQDFRLQQQSSELQQSLQPKLREIADRLDGVLEAAEFMAFASSRQDAIRILKGAMPEQSRRDNTAVEDAQGYQSKA